MELDSLDEEGLLAGAVQVPSPNCDERPGDAAVRLLVVHNISLPPGQFGGEAIVQLFTNTLDFGAHPYYEKHHSASLPTVRLVNPDPLIGQIIEGKYELTGRVGEGGMSVVYRARRVHIGDEVAVKVLLRKFASDDDALARFRREASAAAISHHPNVIQFMISASQMTAMFQPSS